MATTVVKVGTSSITGETGELDDTAVAKLCSELAAVREQGHEVVLVSSGAIAAGMPVLGLHERPTDVGVLQAIAAVGQPRLMERFGAILAGHGLVSGQVLLTARDFGERDQYLHARETLRRLLDLGVVPIVNENDTVADDEIRYGDNDRLAALVANLVNADVLVLLTDTAGLHTADPRLDAEASLIEEIVEVDAALEAVAGGAGTVRGSGGMASKLAAAKIAAWSGVRVVIAGSETAGVVLDAVEGRAVGTAVRAREGRLPSRKLWIAFARGANGRVVVDGGARKALCDDDRSLLPAGVAGVEGSFAPGDAIEVVDDQGAVFAKGLSRYDSNSLSAAAGKKTSALPEGSPQEVIHKDDLVVLP
ncbi:MAG: glutamate 5-kinase [Actinobacteria bacterium]|nr:glutamate 5-kinase [Actinomycetota bacterium]